jgi:hypothetical protein
LNGGKGKAVFSELPNLFFIKPLMNLKVHDFFLSGENRYISRRKTRAGQIGG